MEQEYIEALKPLLQEEAVQTWVDLCALIENHYDMEKQWGNGGKRWTYEYKYRRGGKTLCALYAKEEDAGCLIILGKAEQEKFEESRKDFSNETNKLFDETETYHDGKWLMIPILNDAYFDDIEKLLFIKRKPNRK